MNTLTNTPLISSSLSLDKMRHVRSFVRREGRMTERQEGALAKLWKKYGLSPEKPFNSAEIFDVEAPLVVEIGFGMGHSLLQMAQANPHKNYIGIEVHRPGIGALMAGLEENHLQNVRIYAADAILVLKECLPHESVSEVLIYFPDPWPKKRHHKRRLIQSSFIKIILNVLKPGGILHCATDWEDYAQHMMSVLSGESCLKNTAGESKFSERPVWRPETKFEQRGQRLGHAIYDLIFQKLS